MILQIFPRRFADFRQCSFFEFRRFRFQISGAEREQAFGFFLPPFEEMSAHFPFKHPGIFCGKLTEFFAFRIGELLGFQCGEQRMDAAFASRWRRWTGTFRPGVGKYGGGKQNSGQQNGEQFFHIVCTP